LSNAILKGDDNQFYSPEQNPTIAEARRTAGKQIWQQKS
jgi:hypothetical protein